MLYLDFVAACSVIVFYWKKNCYNKQNITLEKEAFDQVY
jgi:hypothetical protein